ncbi:MAG TPA: GNAT family N-acetyltransferase [Actinomycetota bacterium]|nr:GNAT family N-acetyltransferase [Actinomycetota bacterium]
MTVTVRECKREELRYFLETCETTFLWQFHEQDLPRWERLIDPARLVCAFDEEAMVGTGGAYTFSVSVPGGDLPAAGVTLVGVLPSHRRRGVLTQMMRFQLDDIHRRGEPLAVLWASEAAIYRRFGYGLATLSVAISADRHGAAFRVKSDPVGRTRLLSEEEAAKVLPAVYERVRKQIPGMFSRSEEWWKYLRLPDPEYEREGAGPTYRVVWENEGDAGAYALYRAKHSWEDGLPASKLEVREVVALDGIPTREIWRFLFGVDLMARVESRLLPADTSLLHLMAEPRRLRLGLHDGLWLRIVDIQAALSERSYAADGSLAFAFEDELCSWNSGTWRLSASGGMGELNKVDDAPELTLDAAALGSVYLGGFSFAELARAGRITEHVAGAIARADALFRTDRAPWCPQVF